MTSPLLSIAIPVYNRVTQLAETIASLGDIPSNSLIEVVICDNASTDGSDRVAADHPNIRTIRNSANLGLLANHNRALHACNGKYVFFLHSDETLDLSSVAPLLSLIGSFNQSPTAPSLILPADPRLNDLPAMKAIGTSASIAACFSMDMVEPSGCAFHRRSLLSIGGFHEDSLYLTCSTVPCLATIGLGFIKLSIPTVRRVADDQARTSSRLKARGPAAYYREIGNAFQHSFKFLEQSGRVDSLLNESHRWSNLYHARLGLHLAISGFRIPALRVINITVFSRRNLRRETLVAVLFILLPRKLVLQLLQTRTFLRNLW